MPGVPADRSLFSRMVQGSKFFSPSRRCSAPLHLNQIAHHFAQLLIGAAKLGDFIGARGAFSCPPLLCARFLLTHQKLFFVQAQLFK